jgi:hypothetical protein
LTYKARTDPRGRSRTATHAIRQVFYVQAVASEDLLVALKIDRIGQLTEYLANELVRIPYPA